MVCPNSSCTSSPVSRSKFRISTLNQAKRAARSYMKFYPCCVNCPLSSSVYIFLPKQRKVQRRCVQCVLPWCYFSGFCCFLLKQQGLGNQSISCDSSIFLLKKMILCSVIVSGLYHTITICHAGISR